MIHWYEEKVGAKNDSWVSLKSHWYPLLMGDLEERLLWLREGLVNGGEIKMLT